MSHCPAQVSEELPQLLGLSVGEHHCGEVICWQQQLCASLQGSACQEGV